MNNIFKLQSNPVSQAEYAAAFRPIVRSYLKIVSVYYLVVTIMHLPNEQGIALPLLTGLSALSSLIAGRAFKQNHGSTSVPALERAGLTVNGLLLANTIAYHAVHYDSGRLVYFIMMVVGFAISGVTLRIILPSCIAALASMYVIIWLNEPALLSSYVYITITGGFASVGMSQMIRRAVANAIEAKLAAMRSEAEAAEAAKAATTLSITDTLTALPNRRAFFKTMRALFDRPAAALHPFALVMIDLDGFKPVNDTYGHATGDTLLIEVGKRLRATLPDEAYLARLGGDEFVAIVPGVGAQAAEALGKALCCAMTTPFNLGRMIVHISASIGIKLRDARDATVEQIMERADHALYRVKGERKGQYRIFCERDEKEMKSFFQVDQALRTSDLERELKVVYQPQHDIVADRVVGFEALARWTSDTLGEVAPDVFIRAAETSGLISQVTRVLLRKALAEVCNWPDDVIVSFNLSVHDVMSLAAVDGILEESARSGVAPSRICFEITETVMMRDIDQACAALQKLVDAGHQIALDDFGTGYSNFAYLHQLPVHKIKIDRSFVRNTVKNAQSSAVISTIINLSRTLRKECIVEGVESVEELAALRCIGARIVQGYFFGRPMEGHQAAALLAASDRAPRKKPRSRAVRAA